MKSSVMHSSVQINDQNIDDIEYLEPYTLYINPYYVVTELKGGDKVSKHYYMNTQRVATDISINYQVHEPMAGPQQPNARDPKKPSEDTASVNYNAAFADLQATLNALGHQKLEVNGLGEQPTLEEYYPELLLGSAQAAPMAKGALESTSRVMFWYHPDYLGNVDLVTERDGKTYEFFTYNPWGEEMHQYNANTFSFSSPYRFNAKEKDQETGLHYYGARYYQSKLSVWLSVDPRASEMPEWSPYAFSFNNPVLFVDPDGEKPTIYVEGTGGIGHAFMTVGKGDNLVVYTYGRYLGGGKGKSSANRLDPSGKGVMIKLTGAEAQRYVDHQLEDNNARGYELNDIADEDVASYYDNLMKSGRELTQEEASKYDGNQNKYGTSEDARVLNEYELMSTNCATYCTDGAEAAGTSETFSNDNTPLDKKPPLKATTPFSLMLYLENQINNNNQNVNRVENP